MVALVFSPSSIHAENVQGSCQSGAYWVYNGKVPDNAISAPLSGCQAETIGTKQSATQDIMIGGKGSSSVIGIDGEQVDANGS
jgi:hypothetical protein